MFETIEDLKPEVPKIENIVGVERLNITIEHQDDDITQKYSTPPLHFMIYKNINANKNDTVLDCVCLEFGRFHTMKINEKGDIERLIEETMNLVAEHIRVNVFEQNNDLILQQLQTDFMNDFWKIYRVYSMIQVNVDSKSVAPKQQAQQATDNIEQSLNSKNLKNVKPTSKDILKPEAA